MQLQPVVMVLVDISGYTRFIKHRIISLLHAEQIITDLLEVVIEKARFPLKLNKLEGDAAFFYADVPIGEETTTVFRDIFQQVSGFFKVFADKRDELCTDASICPCDACRHLKELRLKAVVHSGEVVVKRVRQFEELAGEEVILIHRLLKNSLMNSEYIIFPEIELPAEFNEWKGQELQRFTENYDDIGQVRLLAWFPHAAEAHEPDCKRKAALLPAWLALQFKWLRRFFSRRRFIVKRKVSKI